MRHDVIHIQPEAPAKPPVGQPCNGCGVCCLAEPCPVGMIVSRRRHGACDALVWDGAKALYRCGIVSEPQRFVTPRWLAAWAARLAPRWISAGSGCDCDLEPESAPAPPAR